MREEYHRMEMIILLHESGLSHRSPRILQHQKKLKNKQKAIILKYGKGEKQGRDMNSVAKNHLLKKRTQTSKNE